MPRNAQRIRRHLHCQLTTTNTYKHLSSKFFNRHRRGASHSGVVHATFNVSKADATILAILSPAASKGPFLVDVSGEEPWKSLR